MASSSSERTRCFLANHFVKPLAAFLLLAFVGLVGWVAVIHMETLQGTTPDLAYSHTPLLGVQVVDPDAMVARLFSFPPGGAVLINHVLDGSPAGTAGLRPGDAISGVNGHSIRSTADLAVYLDQAKHGDLLSLTVIRGGLMHDLTLPAAGDQAP